jgi:hypothetical protein
MDSETPATYAVQTLPIRDEGANNEIAVGTENAWFGEPLSVTGILNRSFDIFKTHFWNLTATSAIFWLVFDAIIIGAEKLGGGRIVGLVVIVVGLPLYRGAVVNAVSSIYLGREAPVKESYTITRHKAKELLLSWFSVLLVILGWSIVFSPVAIAMSVIASTISGSSIIIKIPIALALLCAPLYLSVKFGLIWEIIMIEGVAYSAARRRSSKLLSGNVSVKCPKSYFTRYAILMSIGLLVYGSISVLLSAPGCALIVAGLNATATVLSYICLIASHILGYAFFSVASVVFYYDIRNRKEGFDLQQLASRVSR